MRTEFSAKAISILSMPSPFFETLWPIIFEVADRETQDNLCRTHHYFHGMWKRCDDSRKDAHARAKYTAIMTKFEWPDDFELTHLTPLWYAWNSAKVSLSAKELDSFCAAADVDPTSGHKVADDGPVVAYLSRQRDLMFVMTRYANISFPDAHCFYSLACMGVREKTELLEMWWRGFYLRKTV